MDEIINDSKKNFIKLYSPNGLEEFIKFTFEKSAEEFHCIVSIDVHLENEFLSSEKWSINFNQILKIANWYKAMSSGNNDKQADLVIPELNLKFTNYYFEKGEGVYNLIYRSKQGKLFRFQFWEQVGSSNIFIYNEWMKCLENLNKI